MQPFSYSAWFFLTPIEVYGNGPISISYNQSNSIVLACNFEISFYFGLFSFTSDFTGSVVPVSTIDIYNLIGFTLKNSTFSNEIVRFLGIPLPNFLVSIFISIVEYSIVTFSADYISLESPEFIAGFDDPSIVQINNFSNYLKADLEFL